MGWAAPSSSGCHSSKARIMGSGSVLYISLLHSAGECSFDKYVTGCKPFGRRVGVVYLRRGIRRCWFQRVFPFPGRSK